MCFCMYHKLKCANIIVFILNLIFSLFITQWFNVTKELLSIKICQVSYLPSLNINNDLVNISAYLFVEDK